VTLCLTRARKFNGRCLADLMLCALLVIGIVSAPLWNSKTSTFAGLLTSSDYINVIQYYWQFPEKMDEIDKFTLESLRGCLDFPGAGLL
jgi:5'-AMP-activated protein kinase regulatory gamma subunit